MHFFVFVLSYIIIQKLNLIFIMSTPHEDENDYRESEDEDFNPDKIDNVEQSESESDSDSDNKETETSETRQTRQTRSKHAIDETDSTASVKESKPSVDIDSLWQSMNKPTSSVSPVPKEQTTVEPINEEYITIDRTFKFAGKVTHEVKRVLASSAEAKAYLKEKAQAPEPSSKLTRKPPRKRKSSLLEELEAGKAKKVNTLEKSRLDWLGFVDKEGIRDDLTKYNKGGYLHKQDFLSRVERNIHNDMTSNKSSK